MPADGYTTANKVTFTVNDTNEVQKVVMKDDITRFDISKVDITTGEELPGATLEVRDENDKLIDTWVSTKEPHRIEKLTVGKTYTLIEVNAPEGYVKAESIKFIVEDTNEIQLVTMKDKYVSISKHDITNDLELEGAFLQVVEKETNLVVDQWISTKEEHKVNGLEEGKEYILKEITAPFGYEIAESMEFIVSGEMEDGVKVNQNIVMNDKLILTSITVNKIDSIEKKKITNLDFEFGLYSDKECQNLIMSQQSNTGTIIFENLVYGVYYLKELKAPDGYNLNNEVVEIVIDDELKTVDHNYTIDFENDSYIELQTGDDFRIGVYLLGMVLSIIYMMYAKFKLSNIRK